MYVRFKLDNSGRVFLEQYISFSDAEGREKGSWENVPVVGLGTAEALSIPLGINCGVFLIDEVDTIYDQAGIIKRRELTAVHCVSALSVTKIIDKESKTLFHTNDGKLYMIKIPQIEFIELLTKALSKFMIIKIDIHGNIKTV